MLISSNLSTGISFSNSSSKSYSYSGNIYSTVNTNAAYVASKNNTKKNNVEEFNFDKIVKKVDKSKIKEDLKNGDLTSLALAYNDKLLTSEEIEELVKNNYKMSEKDQNSIKSDLNKGNVETLQAYYQQGLISNEEYLDLFNNNYFVSDEVREKLISELKDGSTEYMNELANQRQISTIEAEKLYDEYFKKKKKKGILSYLEDGWDNLQESSAYLVGTLGDVITGQNIRDDIVDETIKEVEKNDTIGNLQDNLEAIAKKAEKTTKKVISDEIASTRKLVKGEINLKEWTKETTATATVTATTIASGVNGVVEDIYDGLTWVGGKATEGVTWLVAQGVGVVSKEGKEVIMDQLETYKEDIKEFIATDIVKDSMENIYENTNLGRNINKYSNLKYDSEEAMGVQNLIKGGTEIGLATLATIATGGTASVAIPLALGFLDGTGKKAENIYQNGTNTTAAQEISIFISGVGESANWYAKGKLGENVVNMAKAISENGVQNLVEATKKAISTGWEKATSQDFSKNFNWLEALKDSSTGIDLTDSIGVASDNVAGWLNADEKFTVENVLKALGEVGVTYGINTLMNGITNNLKDQNVETILEREIIKQRLYDLGEGMVDVSQDSIDKLNNEISIIDKTKFTNVSTGI